MSKHIINRESFTKAMREAVAERGESWTYPSLSDAGDSKWRNSFGNCVYAFPDGSPACLIGLALYKIDPTIDLVGAENRIATEHDDTSVMALFKELGVEDRVLYNAAASAQRRQDRGQSWGSAPEAYETSIRQWGGRNV